MIRYTDRSRVVATHECRRLRFLGWDFDGKGLSPAGEDIDALRGHAIHEVLGRMLAGEKPEKAIQAMQKAIGSHWICQMAEGIGWVFFYNHLPRLLRQYKILWVEKEVQRELWPGMIFQARSDAMMEDRVTKQLVQLSIKTKKRWDEKALAEYKVDMQGLSESWAVENDVTKPIHRMQMLYVMVGNPGELAAGQEININPAWVGYRVLKTSGKPDYAHSHNFLDKRGQRVRLGPEYTKFEPFLHYPGGLQQWVKDCLSGLIQPSAKQVFDEMFVKPAAQVRSPEAIANWAEQTKALEWDLAQKRNDTLLAQASGKLENFKAALNENYPQNTKHCFRYGMRRCGMFEICHGSSSMTADQILENPIKSKLFEYRKPNHPEGQCEEKPKTLDRRRSKKS